MNIAKNDTVKINCQPELGEGIVRDIFQIESGPTNIVVSFGDQGKIDYFFPCELTKVGGGCPKCGNTSCKCQEDQPKQTFSDLRIEVNGLFMLKLRDLLQIPVQNLTPQQASLLIEMYRLTK